MKDRLPERLQPPEGVDRATYFRNMSQAFAIAYQLETEKIKTALEFDAELFSIALDRDVVIDPTRNLRQEMEGVLRPVTDSH